MEINNKDLELLKTLYDSSESCTIYNITKKIYPKLEGYREISDKSSTVRQRMNKLKELNLIIELKLSKKSEYQLNRKNVVFADNSTLIIKRKKIDYGAVCQIKMDGVLRIFQFIENT